MATRSVRLPDIGEGVAEAELVEWHVKIGDEIREDQLLAAVMTDKATVEIPASFEGKVVALGADVGSVIAVGSELVRLEVAGAGDPAPAAAEKPVQTATAPQKEALPSKPIEEQPAEKLLVVPQPTKVRPSLPNPLVSGPPRAAGEKPLASPAVRLKAKEHGVDLRQVRGSGPAGRITHEDLDRFLAGPIGPAPAVGMQPRTEIQEIKVIGLRRRIAQKMAEAKRRIAHFSYVEEVDVTALEDLRKALNAGAGAGKPKLTMIPFFMKATIRALADFPGMNALYDDEAEIIHRHAGAHIGIATQTPSGLMVPVIRHAEVLDLWSMANEVKRLADAARDGTATRDELSGSTITITSLGALGGIVSTPVINRPEVAIIGINKVAVRPVWQNNAFVPRQIMNLSSSFDHRVVDGYDAAQFIQRIKGLLETPATLFIEA